MPHPTKGKQNMRHPTQQLDTRPETPEEKTSIFKARATQATAAIVIFAAAVSFATIKIHNATLPVRLPANAACLELAKQTPAQLKAAIDAQFGIETPADAPTKEQVAKLKTDCETTVDKSEFVVGK